MLISIIDGYIKRMNHTLASGLLSKSIGNLIHLPIKFILPFKHQDTIDRPQAVCTFIHYIGVSGLSERLHFFQIILKVKLESPLAEAVSAILIPPQFLSSPQIFLA